MYARFSLAPKQLGLLYWVEALHPRIERSLLAFFAGAAACGFMVYGFKSIQRKFYLWQQTYNDVPIGLPNPKNICYFNALLQAMASNATLVRFLQRSACIRRNKLLFCLVCLLKGLRCPSRYLTANNLDTTLRAIHKELLVELNRVPQWSTAEQQDAHELFNFFMDIACFRELGHTALRAADGLTSVSKLVGQRYEKMVPNCYHRYRIPHCSSLSSLTLQSPTQTNLLQQHLLATQVTCSRCEYRSSPVLQPEACITVFFDTSMNKQNNTSRIPDSGKHHGNGIAKVSPRGCVTLGNCLHKQFCVNEPLPDMHCPRCQTKPGSSGGSSAPGYCQKSQWIAHLPPCLVMHVQRSHWYQHTRTAAGNRQPVGASFGIAGMGVKCSDYLVFPYKLDMTRYVSRKLPSRHMLSGDSGHTDSDGEQLISVVPKLYLLRAILVHQGNSIHSGHYITYRTWMKPDPTAIQKKEYLLLGILRRLITSVSNFFHGISNIDSQLTRSPWILASDTRVSRVTTEEVRTSTAYLLFYERTGSYNMPSSSHSTWNRQSHRIRASDSATTTTEYTDWEQTDTGPASPSTQYLTTTADETDDDDHDDAEDYGPGDESDELSDVGNDFLITTGSKADIIRSLALAISKM